MAARLAYASGGPLPPLSSSSPRTLVQALKFAAKECPHAGITVYEGSCDAVFISYPVLLASAYRIASGLQSTGLKAGECVLLDTNSPRALLLSALWGCIFQGLRPCICNADDTWEFLGRPIVLSVGVSKSHAWSIAAWDISDWLRSEASAQAIECSCEAASARSIAFLGIDSSDTASLQLFQYTHSAVLSHVRSESLCEHCSGLLDTGACRAPSSLNWLSLREPVAVLMHCSAVCRAADEVHMLTGGDPIATLRVLSRHSLSRFAAPASFYLWALSELKTMHANDVSSTWDLSCVTDWTVHGDLGSDVIESFLKLAYPQFRSGTIEAPVKFHQVLLAPWGNLVAITRQPLENPRTLLPAPGVEIRVAKAESTARERQVGLLQIRSPSTPVLPEGYTGPTGWSKLGLLSAIEGACLTSTPESPRLAWPVGTVPISVAGVEYWAEEVESVVDGTTGVRMGCTAAFASSRGLVVALVAEDPSPAAASAVVTSVRGQLTITLGIHPQLVLPFTMADFPRDAFGRPHRDLMRSALENGAYDNIARAAASHPQEILPDEWTFEEELCACSLDASSDVVTINGVVLDDAEDDDGDDIEERMEGAFRTEAFSTPFEGEATEQDQEPSAVIFSDTCGLADAVAKKLDETHGKHILIRSVGAAWDNLATLPKLVVHCRQYDELSKELCGSEAATELLLFLKACITLRSDGSQTMRLLCVSSGRHVRVAAEKNDPRKSVIVGVLLTARLELPWLLATQLDASAMLPVETLANSVVMELFCKEESQSPEAFLDSEGQRLVRSLRPATVLPQTQVAHNNKSTRRPLRVALLAGGAGGIGTLLGKTLDTSVLLLLGRSAVRSPRVLEALQALETSNSEVRYLCADLASRSDLEVALVNSCAGTRIDFAANLCEAFSAPTFLCDLPKDAFNASAAKLSGAKNLLAVLTALRPLASRHATPVPVLHASSAVGLLGAVGVAPYVAGVRAIEALCASSRLIAGPLDPRCVALSAWAATGITATHPDLERTAPAAGLHVLSREAGVMALEAVFKRFAAPRFGMLAIGVNSMHPRFAVLARSSSTQVAPATATATMPGCIELVGSVVKKVLGQEVKLGDSLVDAGLDSMTSMSLHSKLYAASGNLDLPSTLFYDHPTLLELAQFVHRQSKAALPESEDGVASDGEGALDDAVEAMLEDADARRSYHLGLARDAFRRGCLQEARDRCDRAAVGAEGPTLASVKALEADILEHLGEHALSGKAYQTALEAREAVAGMLHPDVAVAATRYYLWALKFAHPIAMKLEQRLIEMHTVFFQGFALPTGSWPPSSLTVLQEMPGGAPLLSLKTLSLDAQGLQSLPTEISKLESLEVLRLRRNELCELPHDLGRLLQLRVLLLTQNLLSDLPAELGNLPRLQHLALEGNRLSRLPAAIFKMKRLLELGLDEQRCTLSDTRASPLPAPVLAVLRARGCGAEFPMLTPPSTGVPNLNTVFWAHNGILMVPTELAQFNASLRLLDLAHNCIEAVGEELFSLDNLRDLSLAGNRLTDLPAAIGRMRRLQQLWLHGNFLEHLPDELGELSNLAILELHHNRLLSLPSTIDRLTKLNWLFAHGNQLTEGSRLIRVLGHLPRLKICGLGANRLQLDGVDLKGMRVSFGLGWNEGLRPEDGVLSEALTTCDFSLDLLKPGETQDVLVVTFSSQGAPVAQGQAEVRALRDALLKVDALYLCDPANAWYLQDPSFTWSGLRYFEDKIKEVTERYKHVFMWGGSMGGSAALLFASLADCVHAFSPQVDLSFTWPTFASDHVRDSFYKRVQESVRQCERVVIHVGEENHVDMRHAASLPSTAIVVLHDTANHNTMKHVKLREKLLPLLKFEVTNKARRTETVSRRSRG